MESEVKIHDKVFVPYINENLLQNRILEIAEQMNQELRDANPIFLAILNGSFFFAADLLRELDFHCQISFVRVASYQGTQSTGEVKELLGIDENLKGRNVVVLEDIVDTGLTMQNIVEWVSQQEANQVKVATMTVKREALTLDVPLHYVGFDVPNKFLVGYGLDYDQLGRNLKGIYQPKE